MDASGRKMTRITIHVKHFTEVKSWKALDLTIGFRYEEGVDVVVGGIEEQMEVEKVSRQSH